MPPPIASAGPARAALLPPEELLRLGSLDLIARLAVEGTMPGRHRSPGRGGALEFAEHRPYAPGDDLRRVDWKVYGRTDRVYVRESEEETNLRATIVLDASASMDYGTPVTKFAWARALAAALTHLLIGQHDAVGLALFAGGPLAFLPPRGGRLQRARILEALAAARPAGETAPEGTFHELAERLPRRGLLVVLSDLLGPPERFLPGLRYLRTRKHEVVVFQVLDPAEQALETLGDAPAVADAETGRVLRTGPLALAEGYRAALAELQATWRSQAHDRGFDFVTLSTADPIGLALGRYLAARRAR